MTSAEFKTCIENLGLSVPDIARIANVSERTIRYWCSGRYNVPEGVAELLNKIDVKLSDAFKRAIVMPSEPITIALLRYKTNEELWQMLPAWHPLPATTHAVLLWWVKRHFEALDCPVGLIFFDQALYQTWLINKGYTALDDNQDLRAAWAAEQLGLS